MIEQALYEHLQAQPVLGELLATYDRKPAVFNQEAPDDLDEKWGPEQYARLVFSVAMADFPRRRTWAALSVDILCKNGGQVPEALEPVVKSLLDGYFFASGELMIAAKWRSTKYFTEPVKKGGGCTLLFHLLEFPRQETTEPDPVALLNRFLKTQYPHAFVVGVDPVEARAWRPTALRPVLYWSLRENRPCSHIPGTYACSWTTAVMELSIFAGDKNSAAAIAKHIDSVLAVDKRLLFADQSPLMMDLVRVKALAQPPGEGQLYLEASYGELRPASMANPIEKINTAGTL